MIPGPRPKTYYHPMEGHCVAVLMPDSSQFIGEPMVDGAWNELRHPGSSNPRPVQVVVGRGAT